MRYTFITEVKEVQEVAHGLCKCGNVGQELHTCPFKTEILDDYTSLCNCCDKCEEECSYEI